jgi:hypothetical protein
MRPECAKGISNGRDGGDAPKFIPPCGQRGAYLSGRKWRADGARRGR